MTLFVRPIQRAILLLILLTLVCVSSAFGQADEGQTSGSPQATAALADDSIETITVIGHHPQTATSTQTIPAENFELRPLESGGQMLEAVPNVLTAQHTGGGKAEQYFVRGFDADHGTDLAIYFDGVPVNLRSHAHGQGFLDLHFVTPETIDRLDAHKGPYSTRFGDFSTAATIEYQPRVDFDQSKVKVAYGEFDTFRAVGVLAPQTGVFSEDGPARGYLSFEAYHTDGPFTNDESLWRYSAFARGELDLSPKLKLSGHLLGYYADWNASGLVPQELVRDGDVGRFGSLDPSEGGNTTRVQGKIQLDWQPHENGHLMANAYVSYYDFELFSNFTYFLNDPIGGDGIVQRDRDRIYGGGRIEYVHTPETPFALQFRGGLETRVDDAEVFLGNQTRRRNTGQISDDRIETFSFEPYADVSADPLPWLGVQAGLRVAWFRFEGRDALAGQDQATRSEVRWLPKVNVDALPFSAEGPVPIDIDGIRNLTFFAHFGMGYHSNDARAVFANATGDPLPRALGGEIGMKTRLLDRVDLAFDAWYLNLDDELIFVGDEGTTESAGESDRIGVEFASTIWLLDWWYARGDVAYTWAQLADGNDAIAQAPRLISKASTGVRYEGFSAELNLRHLGERDATESGSGPQLSDYTLLDFAASYKFGFLEVGFAVENITGTNWSSSEFFYESRPEPGGAASEDFHFSPGNPRNVRAWLSGSF